MLDSSQDVLPILFCAFICVVIILVALPVLFKFDFVVKGFVTSVTLKYHFTLLKP